VLKLSTRGVANAVAECSWLRNLLGELHCKVDKATIVFCDNISTVYMPRNPVCEKFAIGEVRVAHIPTTQQLAGIFTKGLPMAVYNDFRRNLNVASAGVLVSGLTA
jgi:hypothetical protein